MGWGEYLVCYVIGRKLSRDLDEGSERSRRLQQECSREKSQQMLSEVGTGTVTSRSPAEAGTAGTDQEKGRW